MTRFAFAPLICWFSAAALLLVVLPHRVGAESWECSGRALPAESGRQTLEQVQRAYGQLKGIEARFEQESQLAALEVSETSSGEVWFRKPGRMKWIYEQPEAQTFIVHDETVWLFQPESNQVLIDRFRKILISDLPVAFLMGIGDLARDFTLKNSCPGQGGIVLDLSPKHSGSGSSLKEFHLLVNRTSSLPEGAQVVDVGDNMTTITLSRIKTDPELGDDIFTPNYPPGTDINDQRKSEK